MVFLTVEPCTSEGPPVPICLRRHSFPPGRTDPFPSISSLFYISKITAPPSLAGHGRFLPDLRVFGDFYTWQSPFTSYVQYPFSPDKSHCGTATPRAPFSTLMKAFPHLDKPFFFTPSLCPLPRFFRRRCLSASFPHKPVGDLPKWFFFFPLQRTGRVFLFSGYECI